MPAVFERDTQIIQVYKTFKKQMNKQGRNISFPKTGDPRKTYTWRSLNNFLTKLEVSDTQDLMEEMVIALVQDSVKKGTLHKGIAILDNKEATKLLQRKLEKDVESQNNSIEKILSTHKLLQEELAKNPNLNLFDLLLQKSNKASYTNMTKWIDMGKMSVEYIAVSKTCRKVLNSIPKNETSFYPTTFALMRMKIQILCNKKDLEIISLTLKNDTFKE